jgi:hypothetical protein
MHQTRHLKEGTRHLKHQMSHPNEGMRHLKQRMRHLKQGTRHPMDRFPPPARHADPSLHPVRLA